MNFGINHIDSDEKVSFFPLARNAEGVIRSKKINREHKYGYLEVRRLNITDLSSLKSTEVYAVMRYMPFRYLMRAILFYCSALF